MQAARKLYWHSKCALLHCTYKHWSCIQFHFTSVNHREEKIDQRNSMLNDLMKAKTNAHKNRIKNKNKSVNKSDNGPASFNLDVGWLVFARKHI